MEKIIKVRNSIISFFYRNLLKPIFFKFDPEDVHDRMVKTGRLLGRFKITRFFTKILFDYQNPKLEQNIRGIIFKNPVGLSAGFDKNAELTDILPSVGFGFAEVGSVTGKPCAGNPRPRLWRLKKSNGLLVYYGLKNDGCKTIARRLKEKVFAIPIGTSIAKTNCQSTANTENGIADYVKAFDELKNIGFYATINISCPNAFGGQPFTDADSLEKLLTEIDKISTKPNFLKISPDLTKNELDAIIQVSRRHKIAGFICANLTKNRSNKKIIDNDVPKKGGLSGKIVEDLANELIKYVYDACGNEFVIIGCGGIFNAQDAYKKIKLGASLVQMITGMIFEGPQVISEINSGLVELLKKDGYKNISEAVGTAKTLDAINRVYTI